MRLALPMLLLTATAALAQTAPDKPFIHDAQPRLDLKGFAAPRPVTVEPVETPRPLPESSFKDDSRILRCGFVPPHPVTIGPGPFEMRAPAPPVQTELGCKPEAPKPTAKGVG
jgi:hypothetical protein